MIHPSRVLTIWVAAVVAALTTPAKAAELQPATVAAWNTYVAATEARIARELGSSQPFLVTDFTSDSARVRREITDGRIPVGAMRTTDEGGARFEVPDGLISHWRGAVLLPGLTLDSLLHQLQHPPESGPFQEDVLALRVLDRRPDELDLFIRMTRTKVVTVTYDTEHRVRYRHHGPMRSSSQSVATRIAEIDDAGTDRERPKVPGQDRGFLWRMNSYWRYEQVPGGVIVELESLTLSRSVPLGLGFVVQPAIDGIAAESMTRTLDNLRETYTSARVAVAEDRR